MSKENEENNSDSVPETEDESNTMTLGDILKAEELLEESADAVLGAGDAKHCTSSEGYKKRQALYSCLTCLPADGKEWAGICLACSYHCHGDHDLVELFTKRNFKCDCGNSLFKGKCCFIDPAKSGVNENNKYNHNFEGKYCTCRRPYPDPEDDIEDEMLQCIVCEDWFHTRHLGSSVPKDYAEMICSECTDKLPFLQYYLGHSVVEADENDSSHNISVTDVVDLPFSAPQQQGLLNGISNGNHSSDISENEDAPSPECKLKGLKILPKGSGATYWLNDFRKILCICNSCMEMYKSLDVPFLPDYTDTVQAYEDEGKEQRRLKSESETDQSQGEQGLQQILSSMDRVQQMEAILGYNDLKSNLKDFLSKFVENKKVVREEDIHEFFSGMQARKRQRSDIPPNCR